MRGKIIAVFSVIVLVVGLLAFALMSARLGDIVANPDQARADAMRSATVANAALKIEALTFERWLDEQSNDPALREPFLRENPQSRSDEATAQADRVFGQASKSFGTPPTVVALVDAEGVVLGRNGSTLMRADKLGVAYPAILTAIKKGVELSLEEGLRLEADLSAMVATTEDSKEGPKAFAEKRAPVWKGR